VLQGKWRVGGRNAFSRGTSEKLVDHEIEIAEEKSHLMEKKKQNEGGKRRSPKCKVLSRLVRRKILLQIGKWSRVASLNG